MVQYKLDKTDPGQLLTAYTCGKVSSSGFAKETKYIHKYDLLSLSSSSYDYVGAHTALILKWVFSVSYVHVGR